MSPNPHLAYSQDPELYDPPIVAQPSAPYSSKLEVGGQSTASVVEPRICGLRRATFWLVLALILCIIAAAVGGGVGGSIAVKNAKPKNEPTSLVVTVTVSDAAATASPSSKPPSSSTSVTPITSTTSSPTSIANPYVPAQPEEVFAIDIACPSDTTLQSNGQTYSCNQGTDYPGHDITGIIAYSLQTCIDACSTYNYVNSNTNPCQAVVLRSDMREMYLDNRRANCWLKLSKPESADYVEQSAGTVAALE